MSVYFSKLIGLLLLVFVICSKTIEKITSLLVGRYHLRSIITHLYETYLSTCVTLKSVTFLKMKRIIVNVLKDIQE